MKTMARGLAAAALLFSVACGSDAPTVTTSPTGPAALTGRVTTSGGTPLVGARVAIRPNPNTWSPSVITNATGEYRFENLPGGDTLVYAEAVQYEPIEKRVNVNGRNQLDFVLNRLAQVPMSGLVQDADTGAAIGGATVLFVMSPGSGANDGLSVMTGSDGMYRFDRVYTANSNVAITAPGYQEWRTGFHIYGPTTMNFQLRRIAAPQTVTGSVGGPPSTWTCTTKVPLGRGESTDAPCRDFSLTMRRAGSADVTLTWAGSVSMQVQIISSPLTPGFSAGGSSGRIDLTATYLPAGNHVVRVVNPNSGNIAIPFTLTLAQRD